MRELITTQILPVSTPVPEGFYMVVPVFDRSSTLCRRYENVQPVQVRKHLVNSGTTFYYLYYYDDYYYYFHIMHIQ